MKKYTYERKTTTNMKVIGFIDTDRMTIEVNGEEKELSTLLSDFDGSEVEFNITVKNKTDVSLPQSDEATIEVAVRE